MDTTESKYVSQRPLLYQLDSKALGLLLAVSRLIAPSLQYANEQPLALLQSSRSCTRSARSQWPLMKVTGSGSSTAHSVICETFLGAALNHTSQQAAAARGCYISWNRMLGTAGRSNDFASSVCLEFTERNSTCQALRLTIRSTEHPLRAAAYVNTRRLGPGHLKEGRK
jgi:hypothetical protein